MLRAVDVIARKRDGHALTAEEIAAFTHAAAHLEDDQKTWEKYQLAALLMAIFCRDMTPDETAMLTAAMRDSGQKYRWDDVPGPKVDKHSTGGVGDKTSLILAPLAAACGVIVPMMSGRGLGHTGGTLDKLEAMPGFRVDLSEDELRACLKTSGVGMIGQTPLVAPADRVLYKLRDVTSTVESIPLITASILSKKLAEGIDALVMDVKAGCGAFMKTRSKAQQLAESIVRVGTTNGVRTEALLTAMDVPLGRAIGNSLETIECLETLKGRGPKDLEDLSVQLAATMVRLAGIATTDADAEQRVRAALTSGAGVEKFRTIVAQQGGDPRIVDDYTGFGKAAHTLTIDADRTGYIADLHAEKLGIGSMLLGAGRETDDAKIDHVVGVLVRAQVGEQVTAGTPILEVQYNDARRLTQAMALFEQAIRIDDAPPMPTPLVWHTITG